MTLVNLTNPGVEPVEGDTVEITTPRGTKVRKQFFPPPVRSVVTHLEDFTPAQLHESFTSDEAIAGLASTNVLVRAQAELLAMKRNKPMNKDDQGYQDAINLLESDGVLDASAATDYRSGIPVLRLQ
jgi:hypothetical protein